MVVQGSLIEPSVPSTLPAGILGNTCRRFDASLSVGTTTLTFSGPAGSKDSSADSLGERIRPSFAT